MRTILVSTMTFVTVWLSAIGYTGADPASLRRHRRASDATNTTIVGGSQQTTRIPYFVHFSDGRCGASLITGDMVLTAAHCVDSVAGGFPTQVRIAPLLSTDGLTVSVDSSKSIFHPSWNTNNIAGGFDVAVLKLSSTVDTATYPPVTLNSDCNQPAASTVLTLYGFGLTSDGGSASTVLKVLDSTFQCIGSTNEFINVFASSTSGVCQGDSGGPAVVGTTQFGVASFVRDGCAKGNADGYARISTYYSWIRDQVCAKATDKNKFSCTTFASLQSAARDGLTNVAGGARSVRNGVASILGVGTERLNGEIQVFPMGGHE